MQIVADMFKQYKIDHGNITTFTQGSGNEIMRTIPLGHLYMLHLCGRRVPGSGTNITSTSSMRVDYIPILRSKQTLRISERRLVLNAKDSAQLQTTSGTVHKFGGIVAYRS